MISLRHARRATPESIEPVHVIDAPDGVQVLDSPNAEV